MRLLIRLDLDYRYVTGSSLMSDIEIALGTIPLLPRSRRAH
jgi:hypothetical protein